MRLIGRERERTRAVCFPLSPCTRYIICSVVYCITTTILVPTVKLKLMILVTIVATSFSLFICSKKRILSIYSRDKTLKH